MALITPEYYAFASTTLTSAYTAASGTIHVNAVTGFSLTNQFRIMISDATTHVVRAILKVTAVGGTGNKDWTVTSDGLDTNAASGDIVDLCLTAGAFDQIRADFSQVGTYASLPTSPKMGDRYQCTDAPYTLVYDGSAWQATCFGYPATIPVSGNFSWVNQGSNTTSDNGYLGIVAPGDSSTQWRMRVATAPATPYTVTMMVSINIGTASAAGVGFRDSVGGKLTDITFETFHPTLQCAHWNSPTSFQAVATSRVLNAGSQNGGFLFFRITDNGTNLIFSVSTDGFVFTQVRSEARTSFLAAAPNQYYFGIDTESSAPGSITLLSLKVT